MDLEFLHTLDAQILGAVAVAIVAIVIGAVFLFSSKKPKGCLDPENFKQFKLVKRVQLSHNVAKFTFALPTPTSVLGLPIGQHISCKGNDGQGEEVIKPYTPTTLDSDVGQFELVIKMYPQGRMSHHFREMQVGEYLAVKGPKEELDTLAERYSSHFNVYYVLNQPPETWDGGVGFVSKEMIQTYCPSPAPDIKILRCGPPPMNKAMAAHLEALGYAPEMLFQF